MVFQEFLPTLGAAFRSCLFSAAQPFYALVAQSCVERAGRCEVVAQGDSKAVDKLIEWLKSGPRTASVDYIEVYELGSGAANSGSFRAY